MPSQFEWKRIRQYFVEFSNNPQVVVSNPDSPDDFRKGRVFEINADATIRVCFESGPGHLIESFQRDELVIIRGDVDIIIPKKENQ